MKLFCSLSMLLWLVSVVTIQAVPGQSPSHVAYIYPAGAKQGTTLEITAGGQGLRKVLEIHVTGQGVRGKSVLTIPGYKKSYGEYLRHFQKEAREKLSGKKTKKRINRKNAKKKKPAVNKEDELPPAPDHPIFRDLQKRTLADLAVLQKRYYKENRQKNRQMDELVLIKLTVDADAAPGMREIRLKTSVGLSNPIRFFVGEKPEIHEREPNDKVASNAPLQPPFILNGQIMAGDVDRFQFSAKAGQPLLIQGHVRSIIPFLADAVPGWFQATLTLYDANGKELSYADDYRFSPDPILYYEIPEDGKYTVQIRDSIYRGRDDFVYRISVGEDPFITQIFPLGAAKNSRASVEIKGVNLPVSQAKLNTNCEPGTTQELSLKNSNAVPYAVDELPECLENQQNDTMKNAQPVKIPVIVNGRIEKPADVDFYKFIARGGDRIVVDVNARRLHSPVDSIVKLMDAAGKVIAWNDDTEELNLGMQTHHADSRLSVRLPKQGVYYVSMGDTQRQGGPEYGYRLRMSRPRPDFELSVTPASMSVKLGCSIPVTVHALRKDGYDGEIKLNLKDAPKGFSLRGAVIPEGEDNVTVTLTAPTDTRNKLFPIRMQGRAKIDRGSVTREVMPGQAMTQAFITKHVMPSKQLMVYVSSSGALVELAISKNAHVRIPYGGETTLRIKKITSKNDLTLKLHEAPDGISLEQKRSTNNAISILLKADKKVKDGTSGNLMIEVLRKQKSKNGKERTVSLGVMPAVPFVVGGR